MANPRNLADIAPLVSESSNNVGFTNTINLGGGVAGGVVYLNGSKVATSGTGLTFDGTNLSLAAPGNLISTIQSTSTTGPRSATLRLNVASAGGDDPAGTISFTYGTGFTQAAAIDVLHTNPAMKFVITNTEQMRLTSTGLGIGLGGSSPAAKLDVLGASGSQVFVRSPPGDAGSNASPLYQSIRFFGYNNTERARITGIDTASNNLFGQLAFWTGSSGSMSERMRLDSSGNLGLGVTPSAWSGRTAIQLPDLGYFVTSGSSLLLGSNIYFNGSNRTYISEAAAADYRQVNGEHRWESWPSGAAGTSLAGAPGQAMTLDALGNLLLGSTSSYRSGRLVVKDVNRTQTSTLANLHVSTTDSQAVDIGGSIGLGGQIGGDETPFGYISGRKENSTSGNYAGYLAFATQAANASVTERARITSSGVFQIANGGAINLTTTASGNGNISFDGSTFTIVSNSSSASLVFSTNSTERARINSSGKLRIGASTTSAAVGDLQINTAAPLLRLQETTTGGDKRLDLGVTSDGNAYIGANQSAQSIEFQTVGAPRMTLGASGNLGVGTNSLDARLHVLGAGDPTVNTVGLRVGLGNHNPITSTQQYGIYVDQLGGRYAPQTGIYVNVNNPNGIFGGPYYGVDTYVVSTAQAYQVAHGIRGRAENTGANYGTKAIGVKGEAISGEQGGGTIVEAGQGGWGGHFTAYGKGNVIGVYADAYLTASPLAGAIAIPLLVATNGTELARVTVSGNLGLKVTPSPWFTGGVIEGPSFSISQIAGIDQTAWATGAYQQTYTGSWLSRGAYPVTLYQHQSGSHTWFTNNVTPTAAGQVVALNQSMTLHPSGNLTVGTTSDSGVKLYGTVIGFAEYLYGFGGPDVREPIITASYDGILDYISIRPPVNKTNSVGNYIKFSTGATAATDRVVINSLGYLAASAVGDFNSPGAFNPANLSQQSYNSFFSNNNDRVLAVLNKNTGGAAGAITTQVLTGARYHLQGYLDTTEVIVINANGNIQNTNNSYGALSDLKLKQDISLAPSQWDDIKNLTVKKFRFKSNPTGPLLIGLVADDVINTSPGLVEESEDFDFNGHSLGTTTKSVKYSVLYMKAIKALQEAMDRIEALEAKMPEIEARL